LLDFFSEKYDNDKPSRKGLEFVTKRTGEVSGTVREGYDVVGSGLVGRMVERWRDEWRNVRTIC